MLEPPWITWRPAPAAKSTPSSACGGRSAGRRRYRLGTQQVPRHLGLGWPGSDVPDRSLPLSVTDLGLDSSALLTGRAGLVDFAAAPSYNCQADLSIHGR